jgi:2-oxoglutarate ferredoxin oxidoreductase subunit delta
LAKKGLALFEEERCKGCELCITACPKKIVHLNGRLNQSGYPVAGVTDMNECIGCAMCALMCPDLVITVKRGEAPCE